MTPLLAELRRFWSLIPPQDRLLFRIGGGALLLLALALLVNARIVQPMREAARGAECKQNLHAIQLAIERFAVDSPDSTYPQAVSDVISAGYLDKLPPNPYTGRPMREYPLDVATLPPGDFVYYKRYDPVTPRPGDKPTGYTLAMGDSLEALRASIARHGG